MTELRRHGRELLEAARRERTPSPVERERALTGLMAAAAQAALASERPAPLAKRLPPLAKLLILVILFLAIAVGSYCLGTLTG